MKHTSIFQSRFIKTLFAVALLVTVFFIDQDFRNYVTDMWNRYVLGQENSQEQQGQKKDKITKLHEIYTAGCTEPEYIERENNKEKITGEEIQDLEDFDKLEAFHKIKPTYHLYINCMFNNAVELLKKSADSAQPGCMKHGDYKKILESSQIIAVDEQSGKSYGLAELVIEEYKLYNMYLDKLEETVKTGLPQENTYTLDAVNESLLARTQQIELEREIAEKAFDTAFLVYDEMRMTYPLHKQLQCLAKNLEDERTQLARIRILSECLPAKFINAATSAHNK